MSGEGEGYRPRDVERVAQAIPSHSWIGNLSWDESSEGQRERRRALARALIDAVGPVERPCEITDALKYARERMGAIYWGLTSDPTLDRATVVKNCAEVLGEAIAELDKREAALGAVVEGGAVKTTERAELEMLRDLHARLAFVDDADQPVYKAWVDAHKHHADGPYIGCPFCRDQFVPLKPDPAVFEAMVTALEEAYLNTTDRFDARNEFRTALRAALAAGAR